VNLTVFSQTDINNQQTKCFSIPTVRKITKDLLSGDSAKAQLGLVNLQLFETKKKSIFNSEDIKKFKSGKASTDLITEHQIQEEVKKQIKILACENQLRFGGSNSSDLPQQIIELEDSVSKIQDFIRRCEIEPELISSREYGKIIKSDCD
jgi:hypothetical protein